VCTPHATDPFRLFHGAVKFTISIAKNAHVFNMKVEPYILGKHMVM